MLNLCSYWLMFLLLGVMQNARLQKVHIFEWCSFKCVNFLYVTICVGGVQF